MKKVFLQSYLKFWAKHYLKRTQPKIVAITGSMGKTSTKEAIFEVLKVKFKDQVRKSEGNLNNETGVPLAILGFKKSPPNLFSWFLVMISAIFRSIFGNKVDILVLEMAADKPGDIQYLTNFVKPDIACLTSIAPAHMAAFGTIEKIAQEKISLLQSLPDDGTAIINLDDENIRKYVDLNTETLTYGINQSADIMAKNITTEVENFHPLTRFQVIKNGDRFRVESPTLGLIWNVYASLAAVAVGKIFEIDNLDIVKGLNFAKSEKHRMRVLRGKKNILLIDDSYNANPVSMRATLDVLKFLPDPPKLAKKIAVIGDMLEIGDISDQAHTLIGEYAREVADIVIAVGDLAQKYRADKYFKNAIEAGEYLLENIRENDIILIKASRRIGLEKVVEALEEGS